MASGCLNLREFLAPEHPDTKIECTGILQLLLLLLLFLLLLLLLIEKIKVLIVTSVYDGDTDDYDGDTAADDDVLQTYV